MDLVEEEVVVAVMIAVGFIDVEDVILKVEVEVEGRSGVGLGPEGVRRPTEEGVVVTGGGGGIEEGGVTVDFVEHGVFEVEEGVAEGGGRHIVKASEFLDVDGCVELEVASNLGDGEVVLGKFGK